MTQNSISKTLTGFTAALILTGCVLSPANDGSIKAKTPPFDVKPTNTVDPAVFASWFQSGKVTANGVVTPADSLQPLNSLNAFYQWSWRMFLWQLSPQGDGVVFNRPPFFDLDESNHLVSNTTGDATQKAVRGGKLESVDRTGQAGVVSGVLMSQQVSVDQNGSLVYYAIHVNDVYAYMASGVNSGDITNLTQFPTTAAERDTIVDYAKTAYNADVSDANALAMELKSSWIKLPANKDASTFVTIKADVPRYTESSDKEWTWDGTTMEEDVTLACVGFHLVGSTVDHPEMIWATFEHDQNAPDANFYYTADDDSQQIQKNWNADGTPAVPGPWLFMDGTSKEASMNQMHMELTGNTIKATPGKTISPSNTSRTHPWGNVNKATSAANNTSIISLNQNIKSQLVDGDVRKHYYLVGATWTQNGVPGVGFQIPEVAGSLTLANATMETYFQYKNCFDCHQGGNLGGLSHIFTSIIPLTKP